MVSGDFGSARWARLDDLRKEGLLTFNLTTSQKNNSDEIPIKNQVNVENTSFILSSALKTTLVKKEKEKTKTDGFIKSLIRQFSGYEEIIPEQEEVAQQAIQRILGWKGKGHITTIAPTRSGKGVGVVIPNLLHYSGSVLVIDPKGENYAITSRFRRETLGQQVIKLDPFGICGKDTDVINPLEGLLPDEAYRKCDFDNYPELSDEISVIADAMIVRSSEQKDSHWDDKARTVIKGAILATLAGLGPQQRRHLGEVRNILLKLGSNYEDEVKFWETADPDSYGMLTRAANEVRSMAPNERSSVIASALKHLEFLDSQPVLKTLGGIPSFSDSTYCMHDLKSKGNVSIYIILPPHHLTRYSRLIRLWLTCAFRSMTKDSSKPADGCPVLFILDEMAQLGRMELLSQAVSLMAGYGMTLWMIWQDIAQIKTHYKEEWNSFLSNSKIQQYFGIADPDTAKYVSEMLGMYTQKIVSTQESKGTSTDGLGIFSSVTGSSTNSTKSESVVGRALLNPDEILRLNRQELIIFVQGCPPILENRLEYFNDDDFKYRADTNPYEN